MKQKLHLKIREKNDKEDNQLDRGSKKSLNKVREKPEQIKNSQWSFLAYTQLTAKFIFKHKALPRNPREKSSIS